MRNLAWDRATNSRIITPMKRFACVLFVSLIVTGCVARRPDEQKPEIRLSVGFKPSWDDESLAMVVVHVHNNSDKPIRVWESWNSWGYNNASLEITLGNNPKIYEVRRGFGVWTINFPSWETIPVGGSIRVFLNIHKGSWNVDQKILDWRGPVRVRPVFSINEDEDTEERGVWTGTARGEWISESTPLNWIPADKTSEEIYW